MTRFSGGFSHSVFEPSDGNGSFSTSAGNLLPQFQHRSKTWVRPFSLTLEQKPCPTPRCCDCTIAFRNYKSFLPKRNYRRTASTDTTRRQLTIRRNNLKLCHRCLGVNISLPSLSEQAVFPIHKRPANPWATAPACALPGRAPQIRQHRTFRSHQTGRCCKNTGFHHSQRAY